MPNIDPITRDLWQVIAATDEIPAGVVETTLLLDVRLALTRDTSGNPVVWRRTHEEQGDEIDPETILDRLPAITDPGGAMTRGVLGRLGSPDRDRPQLDSGRDVPFPRATLDNP